MHRLPRGLHTVWMQAGGHGLDALALDIEQQPGAGVLQGLMPILMHHGAGQAAEVSREERLLRVWPGTGVSHRTKKRKMFYL